MNRRVLLMAYYLGLMLGFLGLETAWAKEEKERVPVKNAGPGYSVPPTQVPDVQEIQKELEKILAIHRTLQTQHYNQIREIQRITEQARAHQKLLETLKVTNVPTQPAGANLDDLVQIEKIRLIEKEAQKNRAALEEIQKGIVTEKKTEEKPPEKPQEKPKKKSSWW